MRIESLIELAEPVDDAAFRLLDFAILGPLFEKTAQPRIDLFDGQLRIRLDERMQREPTDFDAIPS
jgi:hypothetical protein